VRNACAGAAPLIPQIQTWPINRLVFYARNPRKNDAAVDRMCSSIREFGFKIPVLARSDGEVVDGHLRLKAARRLGSWPSGDVTQCMDLPHSDDCFVVAFPAENTYPRASLRSLVLNPFAG
jgi:ParB-like nuclease domain